MPRTFPPVAPTQADFMDEDGFTDYEALDHASEQYVANYAAWWREHGQKQHQIDLCWINRETELRYGR